MLYFMLNKPKGFVSAKKDGLFPTVTELFPEEIRSSLHPVGRLDKDTEGLLLITDDGALTHRLTRPEFHVTKTYFFYAIGSLDGEKIKAVEKGVIMQGRDIPALPAKIRCLYSGRLEEIENFLPGKKKERLMKNPSLEIFAGEITISEGKNHQVKRMLRAIGCSCLYLKRTEIGGVKLDESLKPGEYRPLTEKELAILKTD